MQPHSMCALALANYVWNSTPWKRLKRVRCEIEYRDEHGKYKRNTYWLNEIEIDPSGLKISVETKRQDKNYACWIDITRSGTSEGTKVYQRHRTIHVAGLWEEYAFYKSGVRQGAHQGSGRYRHFAADFSQHRDRFRLEAEVKDDEGRFYWRTYDIKLDSFVMAKIEQTPADQKPKAA